MRRNTTFGLALAGAAAFGLLQMVAPYGLADEKPANTQVLAGPEVKSTRASGQSFDGQKRPNRGQIMMQLLSELDLTAEQKEQIRSIVADAGMQRKNWQQAHRDQLDQLRQEADAAKQSGDREAMQQLKQRRDELMASAPKPEDVKARIDNVLTVEQRQVLETRIEEHKAQMQAMGGPMMGKDGRHKGEGGPEGRKMNKAEKQDKPDKPKCDDCEHCKAK